MELDFSRLRRGELIAAGSALALLAIMFLFKWYGLTGAAGVLASRLGLSASANGWHALTIVRWLMLLTIVLALALAYLQAKQRAPALPVALSVIVTTLGAILVLVLIYRVLINEPGSDALTETKLGAFLGLLSAIGITYGGYASMREEGLSANDARTQVEKLTAEDSLPPSPASQSPPSPTS